MKSQPSVSKGIVTLGIAIAVAVALAITTAAAVALAAGSGKAPEGGGEKERAAARAVLDKHLGGDGAARRARIAAVDSIALKKSFGDDVQFFSLSFPKFPVAIAPSAGLAPDNLFAVSGNKVTHLKNQQDLEKFCVSSLLKLGDKPAASDAVKSCLRLVQAFYGRPRTGSGGAGSSLDSTMRL